MDFAATPSIFLRITEAIPTTLALTAISFILALALAILLAVIDYN